MTNNIFSDSDIRREDLEFLTRFQHNGEISDFNLDYWKLILNKSVSYEFNKLEKRGLIRKATLAEKIKYVYKVIDLREFLRTKGVKVSGNKDELVQRVLEFSSDDFVKNARNRNIYTLTESGKIRIKEYLDFTEEERREAEEISFTLLKNNKILEACKLIGEFEKKQVIKRGLGFDWNNYNPTRDIEIVKIILTATPKILKKIPRHELDDLRIGSAMRYLWGLNDCSKWIPENFQGSTEINVEVATRMLMFYAIHQDTLNRYLANGIWKVKILPAKDSCESCKKNANKVYTIKKVPELPNPKCTHDMGCRCVLIPVILNE